MCGSGELSDFISMGLIQERLVNHIKSEFIKPEPFRSINDLSEPIKTHDIIRVRLPM